MTTCDLEIILGPLSDIPPGEGRNFEAAGERVAVFHTRDGEVFAVQAACPHRGGALADGLVGGTTVVCPLHAWKFDLRSGQPVMAACSIKTYPVRLNEANQVLLTLRVGEVREAVM